jgi:hypothetical protein
MDANPALVVVPDRMSKPHLLSVRAKRVSRATVRITISSHSTRAPFRRLAADPQPFSSRRVQRTRMRSNSEIANPRREICVNSQINYSNRRHLYEPQKVGLLPARTARKPGCFRLAVIRKTHSLPIFRSRNTVKIQRRFKMRNKMIVSDDTQTVADPRTADTVPVRFASRNTNIETITLNNLLRLQRDLAAAKSPCRKIEQPIPRLCCRRPTPINRTALLVWTTRVRQLQRFSIRTATRMWDLYS